MAYLTPAQVTLVKADILANTDLNSQPNTLDGAFEIARLYGLQASPNFTVWRTQVSVMEIGNAFNGPELAGLTNLNNVRLQTIAQYSPDGVNPSLSQRRAFFDDVFSGSGGTVTRANLLALWKRLALRIEKLLATGVGSDASPATLNFEGQIDYIHVYEARNS